MPYFTSEDFELYYEVHGRGVPVMLVHGFASNGRVNWVATGWVETLLDAGYQAILLDNRGHGKSEKTYEVADYAAEAMGRDVVALADELDLGEIALLGYSMGARISAFAAVEARNRVKAVIFGGLGDRMVRGMDNSEEIAEALLAPSMLEIESRVGRQFRGFAEQTGSDLKALATCIRSSRQKISKLELARLRMPVLVAVGSEDDVAGDPGALAELLPNAEVSVIDRRDHMRTTGDRKFKEAVLSFLSRHFPA